MKLDDTKLYRMPLIAGPFFDIDDRPRWDYPHVEVLAFQYLTEKQAIAALIPECYKPADEPVVTILFSQNNGLQFMAGGGYRLAAVQVAVSFDGDQDHLEGDLILVMFEDHTWPILGGREDLGIPKVSADISPIREMADGSRKAVASQWGRKLFSLDVSGLKSQLAPIRMIANRRINARPWLGYKYIPSLDGPPDADYPTISYNDNKLSKLWFGKEAKITYGSAGEEDIGYARNILDALSTLEIVEPLQSLYFVGSAVLRYDLSRRLR